MDGHMRFKASLREAGRIPYDRMIITVFRSNR